MNPQILSSNASAFDNIPSLDEQISLLKERGLDSYLKRDLHIFKQKFDRLRELLNEPANNKNFEEAYQLFYYIFDVVPMMYHRLSDMPIFRAARNKINEVFSIQSRISYNKNISAIPAGKFNVWYQPMFYGCLPYGPSKPELYPPPRLVASLECCKDLYNDKTKLLIQDITIGKWQIREPINAINLGFDHVHLSRNPELKQVNEQFIKHIFEVYSGEAGHFIKDLLEYFSCLCRTGSDEKSYYVLTALFNALKIYHETNNELKVDALISSSAASDGHGLNIVMTPEIVDRCLWLKAVIMDRFFLVSPERNTYSIYPCTEIIENHLEVSDFHFQFKKYIQVAQNYIERYAFKDYGYLPSDK
ncbi:hypothetical protein [Mucilaginibacter aquaedulcis]|uniref:hypothetical protein n=1 Tax=Mucilaginibacter aquaedulcis TaxID=1187081 RepID=UPI0025B38DD5|nr:hypothetical protein [Mucilaginibacter aquaedulcis]MDN3551003.1 hypothetical protein [Mucilaginibacter aquaedulcis]